LQLRSFEAQAMELGLDPLHQSPPERALGYALLALIIDPLEYGAPGYISLFLPLGAVMTSEEMPPIALVGPGVINITAGVWLGDYKPDYLLDVKAPYASKIIRGAIECDGHEYHNVDPDQVSFDRRRDREMLDAGIHVLRYTARDVIDDARQCARTALQILLRKSAERRVG
jgi:hypothetical protein